MASSFDNRLEQDGMCSVYSAQPSETNCSISEALAKEMNAVNEMPDEAIHDASVYSVPKSETNVTVSDSFRPCQSMNQFNLSVYSVPKSETNVTMKEKFEGCKDLRNVLYSVYSAPPSETNVTMPAMDAPSISEYTALASETNATMSDAFRPCNVLQALADNLLVTEHTAKSGVFLDTSDYVDHLQLELGIPDKKVFGIERSDGSVAKIIDSNECLLHLESFQPIPVDFSQMPAPVSFKKSMSEKSVQSYLLHSAEGNSVHHEL
ncbi:unnamed protein product [Caenorhabditis sp. 36 PRJEB53466]|nr:unnamed protein product [Caenorhabditis sp. 36 PRJEB53466]